MSTQILLDLYRSALTGLLSSQPNMDPEDASHMALRHAIAARKKFYGHMKTEDSKFQG